MDNLTKEFIDFGESITNAVNGLNRDKRYNDIIIYHLRQVISFFKAANSLEGDEFKNQRYSLMRGMTESMVNFWYLTLLC